MGRQSAETTRPTPAVLRLAETIFPRSQSPGIVIRHQMPAPLIALGGEIPITISEPSAIYQADRQLVEQHLDHLFPNVNFTSLKYNQLMRLLHQTDAKLLPRLHQPSTPPEIAEDLVHRAISMAVATLHPLAFADLHSQVRKAYQHIRPTNPNPQVLELGYGPGVMSTRLMLSGKNLGLNPEYWGVEQSPAHQAIAARLFPSSAYPNMHWLVGDGTDLAAVKDNAPNLPCHFDLGLAIDVGHHLTDEQYQNLLLGMLGHCTRVIVSDPSKEAAAKKFVGFLKNNRAVGRDAQASFLAARNIPQTVALIEKIQHQSHQLGLPPRQAVVINTGFMHLVDFRPLSG